MSKRPSFSQQLTRRRVLGGLGILSAACAAGWVLRDKFYSRLARLTALPEFAATPALLPHNPAREQTRLAVGQAGSPEANLDNALSKLGGLSRFVGQNDIVLLKVSAQWWNQGMTNVAAVKHMIEQILALPGFRGEVIVFENTHFRLQNGSGLSRAFTHPSERNVDVPGWNKLGDLIPYFAARKAAVSFVGLVDAGKSELASEKWHDPEHAHGVYGGDGRGPIGPDEQRDGYRWDFERTFRKQKGRFEWAQTPLTWPVFTSPHSGITVDLRDGAYVRRGASRTKVDAKLTWITMSTVNEHASTGLTACCKSAMGVVDMSAGRLGSDPSVREYQSVHYFGYPNAKWRMAGPLAHFAREVRAPDLYVAVAEWVGVTPKTGWKDDSELRLAREAAHHTRTVVAGTDPVAIDHYCARNILKPLGGKNVRLWDVDDPDSTASRFLRYYREVYGAGTLLPELIEVV